MGNQPGVVSPGSAVMALMSARGAINAGGNFDIASMYLAQQQLMHGSAAGRGLHSFTIQLNLSALHGIGGVRRGCVARVQGVLGGG